MKKSMVMFLFFVSVSILLIGCVRGEDDDESSITDNFENTQRVEVISTDGLNITTISDESEIESFVDALKIDEWDSADIPQGSTEGKTFKMYQKETLKLGDSENQKDNLNEVAIMTTYKDAPYVKFSLKSFSFNFKVPTEVAGYLESGQY